MAKTEFIIYYCGPKNQLVDRLKLHFQGTIRVLCKEDAMLFEVISNKHMLAILCDLNILEPTVTQQINQMDTTIPIIGISDNQLIQTTFPFITDIAILGKDALTRFDMLERKLANYRKDKFGQSSANKFREYIIGQHMNERSFEDSLRCVYQPIYNLSNGNFDSFEVMLRWPNAPFKDFKINELFSAANNNELINTITAAQFSQIAATLAELHDSNGKYFNTYINLSSTQLNEPMFLEHLRYQMEAHNLAPEFLHFQVHPDEFTEDDTVWKESLREVADTSANVSIKFANADDFQAGELEHYQVNSFKLQNKLLSSFNSVSNLDLVETARKLNINLIGEQIENAQQYDFIQKNGIKHAQGYFFYQPLHTKQFLALMNKKSNLNNYKSLYLY